MCLPWSVARETGKRSDNRHNEQTSTQRDHMRHYQWYRCRSLFKNKGSGATVMRGSNLAFACTWWSCVVGRDLTTSMQMVLPTRRAPLGRERGLHAVRSRPSRRQRQRARLCCRQVHVMPVEPAARHKVPVTPVFRHRSVRSPRTFVRPRNLISNEVPVSAQRTRLHASAPAQRTILSKDEPCQIPSDGAVVVDYPVPARAALL